MTKNTRLKIAAGVATVAAGAAGGVALGPPGMVAGALTALSGFLLGLYHETPKPARAPLDAPPPR